MKHNSSISNFKKIVFRYGIPYMLIMMILLFTVNLIFEKIIIADTSGSGASKVNRILEHKSNEELVILGSSRAEGSIIPDSLAKNCFNYGLSGTQDNVWMYFLEEELKKNNTRPILINFDLDGLGYKNGDPAYWLFNSSNPKIRTFIDHWKPIYSIPVIKHMGYFERYVANYIQERHSVTGIINNGAILETKKQTASEFDVLVKEREKEHLTFINDKTLEKKLLGILQETKNRHIIFFIPPYHESYLKTIQNYPVALEFLSKLDSIRNVSVLNYSQYKMDNVYFYNTTHLNYNGALIFTKLIKEDMANLPK